MVDREYFSAKCRWLSMIAAFAVVGIHSRTTEWTPGVVDWSSRLQNFCIEHCSFAVPMFFLFSGYWFMKSYERHGYWRLLGKKFWSLYVPFVLWCTIGEFAVLPSSFWSSTMPSWGALCGVPLLLTKGLSLAFHLWYVRALLIFFLLAPLCYLIGRKMLLVLTAIVLTRLFPTFSLGPYRFDYVATAIPWFMLGAGLSMEDRLAIRLPKTCTAVGTLVSLVVLVTLDLYGDWSISYFISAHEIRIISMVAFFWFGFDWLFGKVGLLPPPSFCRHTFFVYCVHVVVIRYSGNLLRSGLGTSTIIKTIGYFGNWLSFVVDVVLARLLVRLSPKAYQILSGRRD